MDQDFREQVYALVARIPAGQVATYGQIARLLGAPRSARMVGRALSTLPAERQIPWHRVVNRLGRISERWPHLRMDHQAHLLESEGIKFEATGAIDLSRYRWRPPSEAPLEQVPADSVSSGLS